MASGNLESILISKYISELSSQGAVHNVKKKSPYELPLRHTNILKNQFDLSQKLKNKTPSSERISRRGSARTPTSANKRNNVHRPRSLSADRYPTRQPISPIHANISGNRNYKEEELGVDDCDIISNDRKIVSSTKKSHQYRGRQSSAYLNIPNPFVVTAYKNGTHENGYRVSAPNIDRLLEFCTQRLNLRIAAKRIFLQDGTEITSSMSLPRGTAVFVSSGEQFKDPYKEARKRLFLKRQLSWSVNGIRLPEEKDKDCTKPQILPETLGIKSIKRRILVFVNGKGHDGSEFICDLDNITELLQNCTNKFNIGKQFKKIFIWNGTEITNLHDTPEYQDLFNNSISTPLLGPIWITTGENLSPSGVENYLSEVLNNYKKHRERLEAYLEQLDYARQYLKENNLEAKVKIYNQRVLSISEDEIYDIIDKEEYQLDKCKHAIKETLSMKKKIEKDAIIERENGSKYTMKHISAISDNHTLLGRMGLRLKVYQNGENESPITFFFNIREASRGIKLNEQTSELLFQRFLDKISENIHIASRNNHSRGILAKRIFRQFGKEITDIKQLEYDDEIWISYGESWIDPHAYCVQVILDKIIQQDHRNETKYFLREDFSTSITKGMERSSLWNIVNGAPEEIQKCEFYPLEQIDDEAENDTETYQLPENSIPNDLCLLQYTVNKSLCLYPEVVIGIKKMADCKELWPKGSVTQVWMINQTGHISLKVFPLLVLSVTTHKVEVDLNGKNIDGYVVQFQEKQDYTSLDQEWIFGKDGLIYSKAEPTLVLTYFGGLYEDTSSHSPCTFIESTQYPGMRAMLGVSQPLEKERKYQRFALKQEKFENFGQWRHSKIQNPEWNKHAYSWPVDEEGCWIDEFEWPMEAYIIPCAPPLIMPKSMDVPIPKRLFCMRNGERDGIRGTHVTGPDLTNLKKDRKLKKSNYNDHHEMSSVDGDENYLHVAHCNDWTVTKLEFQLFLERCTSLLNMNTAARRLFDKNGIELFSLKDTERDQLVYVSAGELWIDLKLSKEELRERALLVKLAEDVSKIRTYVNLRNCANLIVSVENDAPGSSVHIRRSRLIKRKEKTDIPTTAPEVNFDSNDEVDSDVNEPHIHSHLTAHQIACSRSDEKYMNKLRWPYERIVNDDLDDISRQRYDSSNEVEYTDRYQNSKKHSSLTDFLFEDDYITLSCSDDLVLTASNGDSLIPVTLEKRNLDNVVNQKWIFNSQGYLILKYRPHLALTVFIKPSGNFDPSATDSGDHVGSKIIVSPLKTNQFGRANQMFSYDPGTQHISAFATNALDCAITAANYSGVCSYAITNEERLDQPGYSVFLPTESAKVKQFEVCSSCAKALRGKYKLQKLLPSSKLDFSCSFGSQRDFKIKEKGSFHLLNGKVDLSDSEAHSTLQKWEDEIKTARENLAVKPISTRLNAAKTPRTYRFLAYRNGEGRLAKPTPIIASSLMAVMEQCTIRLGFSTAVRKLFLEDGTPVVDIEDLQHWCRENTAKVQNRQSQIDHGHLQPEIEDMQARLRSRQNDTHSDSGSSSQSDIESERARLKKQSLEHTEDTCEPRLKNNCFVIGKNLKTPDRYCLSISLYSVSFLDQLLSQHDLASSTCNFLLRYTMFGQVIETDSFSNEEDFSGEKREIQIKSELPYLRKFFATRLKYLEIYLIKISDDSILATCYVPLDGLIREEHEEFVHSAEIGGDFAWYKKTKKSRKDRTKASLYVKADISLSLESESEKATDENDQEDNRLSPEDHLLPVGNLEIQEQRESQVDEVLNDIDASSVVYEVWASGGEAFISLETAHSDFQKMMRNRKDMANILLEKDIDKHIVRMMRGRRFKDQDPSSYRTTTDPENPVVVEGGWMAPSNEELMINSNLERLNERESHLRSQRLSSRKKTAANIDFTRDLYKCTNMIRINAVQNGEMLQNSVGVWGENLQQLLANATMRLGLRKSARILYDMQGKSIQDFQSIVKDQNCFVSMGEAFMKPKTVRENVEIKANWGRAKRKYGSKATDFHVHARSHPIVGVDPFGPPKSASYLSASSARSNQQPTFDSKRILVYENGRHKDSPVTVWGASLDELLRNASKRLKLRSAAICFYSERGQRIMNFEDIARDDLLAVSTTGKNFLRDKP